MKAAINARVSTANNGQDPRVETRELSFLRSPSKEDRGARKQA
jgi:hypothetical protein